ncbi:hypothetical protein [Actinomadura sp. NTSP31]|uniref:D-alanyl-D-alanine carboxypeptidase n=1 Tax=Actinomadura sp. NTSP31 TaxID=1735447 RepID=UPI0035C04511
MNDVPQEPEPDDRPEDVEREPGRTATAEFRVPAPAPSAKDASLTRPDIRRPAKPAGQGPWYVDLPRTEDDEVPAEPAPGEEADTRVEEEDEASEEDAPPVSDPADAEADTEPAAEDPEEPQDSRDAEEEEPETDAAEEPAEDAESEDAAADQEPAPPESEDAEPSQDESPQATAPDEPEPDASSEDEGTASDEGGAPVAEEDEHPEAAALPEGDRWPRAGGSPAAVTRVERLPGPWDVPAPEPQTRGQQAGGDVRWETPQQSAAAPAWGQQAPAGEFRPESVRWDAAQSAPPQGPAAPVHPAQSGPWQVAAPQAPAPQAPAPQAPAPAPPLAGVEERPRRRRGLIVLVAALLLVVGVVAGQLVRPVPDPTVKLSLASSHVFAGAAPSLPWPAAGQSEVYVDGLGTMGSSGGSTPTPTASVAKVMTAYVYLRDHPLKTGEPGPVLAVSPQGVAEIPARKKRGESLLGITAGQRLTERKALEALLIISANDLAHELARWDSGGDQPFVAKMNAAARELGMTGTRYTDPSGYDSGTVSTAADQVKLLRAAMKVPAFTEIVNRRAYVPDDGSPARPGGNVLVGQYGVVGGKTGYTDAAGGNYVFAARKKVGGVPTLVLGAVMAQKSPSAQGAVEAAGQLIQAAENAMAAATLAPKGARVGEVDDGLGGTTPLRAASPVTVVGWPGLRVPVGIQGDPPHRGGTGERVGEVTAGAATVPLVLGSALDEPSYLKRLIRVN